MKLLSCLIALIFLLVSPEPALAQPPEPPGKVYLVVVDKLSINDIDAGTTPGLAALAHKGAIGLVSNRTLGSSNTENGSLTVGAGNLARSFSPGIAAYNVDETVPGLHKSAGEVYQLTTGMDLDSAQCVLISLPALSAGVGKENTKTRLG